MCAFPQDEDYEAALDSKVADIKQCTLDGDADHILATRFLKRFVEHDTPWVHVDLSASRCEAGWASLRTRSTVLAWRGVWGCCSTNNRRSPGSSRESNSAARIW